MSKITVNADAALLLEAVATKAEVCGPDGKQLGYFVPLNQASLEERLGFDPYAEPTLEQLKASDAAGGEIPHEEVMKRLGFE